MIACLVVAVAVTGCGGDGDDAAAPNSPGSQSAVGQSAGDRAMPGGSQTPLAASPGPNRYEERKPEAPPVVRITTSEGPIDIRLNPEAAAVTVQNFLNYARAGHYNQTVFHYVEEGQLILGGGYLEDGSPKPAGPPILNEAHNGLKNAQGTIAMARDASVIDSSTSQFFINLQDAPHLDHAGESPDTYGYCVFGEVVNGLDVAKQISAVPTETQVIEGEELTVPTRTVRIESIQLLR